MIHFIGWVGLPCDTFLGHLAVDFECLFAVCDSPVVEFVNINPLNAELNPICHLLALLGGATIVVVSRLRVKMSKPECVSDYSLSK